MNFKTMTPQQLKYFNEMQPGEVFQVTSAKNWMGFITAAKKYIDLYGTLEFNNDYTLVTKLNPIPKTDDITYFIEKYN